MTIKKRLARSNLLMILLPVCITGAMAAGCLGLVWYGVVHGGGLGFEDSEDFLRASGGAAVLVAEALEAGPEERLGRLEALGSVLDEGSMSLTVLERGKPFYQHGAPLEAGDPLLRAAEVLGGEGTVAGGARYLTARRVELDGSSYQIYLSCTGGQTSYHALKVLLAAAAVVLAFTIFLSVLLTNWFLIRSVFQKIEGPLDLLATGVAEISAGNLDCQIHYDGKDEFAPICRQFNEMAVRLKHSVEVTQRHENSRKELMAGISHDLRSPLTSIQAYVEGLLDGVADTGEKRRAYLLTIRDKAEDISRMVSQIFLYSKMELEDYPVHLQTIRLDALLQTFLRGAQAEYAARGLTVTAEPLPAVSAAADPELLRRGLSNILDNSAKYKTAEAGTLRLRLEDMGADCRLTLTDDGPGVSEEALSRLFDIFYRGDPSRGCPGQGSGLGLSIAARAVARMGGSIAARHAQPHGLTIQITLPKEAQSYAEDSDCGR